MSHVRWQLRGIVLFMPSYEGTIDWVRTGKMRQRQRTEKGQRMGNHVKMKLAKIWSLYSVDYRHPMRSESDTSMPVITSSPDLLFPRPLIERFEDGGQTARYRASVVMVAGAEASAY